jgi:hypothetical protein
MPVVAFLVNVASLASTALGVSGTVKLLAAINPNPVINFPHLLLIEAQLGHLGPDLIQSFTPLNCSTFHEAHLIPIESPSQNDDYEPGHQSKNHPSPRRTRSIYNVKQDFLIHQSTIAPSQG